MSIAGIGWREVNPPGTPTLAWCTELGGILLESVATAGSIVKLGLTPVTVCEEPELETEEAEIEATLTPL